MWLEAYAKFFLVRGAVYNKSAVTILRPSSYNLSDYVIYKDEYKYIYI